MAQPTWNTPAGSIGIFTEQVPVTFTFTATKTNAANTLVYTLLNGKFPPGTSSSTDFSLNSITGILTGTAAQVAFSTNYSFTIRVLEYTPSTTFVSFRDRTFSMTITGSTAPTFTTPAGALFPAPNYLPDSTWTSLQIGITNPDPGIGYRVSLETGDLPPGLEINDQGLIRGYADIPSGTNQTFNFTLKVYNISGFSTRNFSITVVNQNSVPSLRTPTILNTRPLTFNINPEDEYASYYVSNSNNGLTAQLGTYSQNNYFIFKIIGYAFTNNPVSYVITSGSLAPGLSLNTNTGWITGTITVNPLIVETYTVNIRVQDTVNLQYSAIFGFTMVVVDENSNVPVDTSVTWLTPSNLGILDNGEISTKFVKAITNSGQPLTYTITSGNLPQNLQFMTNGEIIGRVAFQTGTSVTPAGSTLDYSFTVTASNATYSEISSSRTFTLSVLQKFSVPYENLYMQALLSTDQRTILDNFLSDTTLIPNQFLYRPNDPYFGKATDIKYMHFFGIETSTLNEFTNAIQLNHYWRNITLGPIKTAISRNENNEIEYEVVYSEIIDDLINPQGESVVNQIVWPYPINGITRTVYPASIPNMRNRLTDSIPSLDVDSSVLPSWMTSQQLNGSTLGFIKAWVICYTLPGKSDTIYKNLMQTYGSLPYKVVGSDSFNSALELDPTINTSSFYVNMPVTFTGTTFGGVATATTYYIHSIVSSTVFRISANIDGSIFNVTNAVGMMTLVPLAGLDINLNDFEFKLDRFTVDNSLTYNFNPVTVPPANPWAALPSSGVTTDSQDFDVFFPQKNILA